MQLEFTDIAIIVGYLVITINIGLFYARRAGRSRLDYFLSGRGLPWWLAGTGMVATTFAADTPLWVAGQVGNYGLSGNWLWWCMAAGSMLTVFFFARLWRRAQVLTDLELIELRYSSKVATFLRGLRAIYSGLLLNCIVMGWVNLALVRILEILLPGSNAMLIVSLCALATLIYVSVAGLWGIMITDLFQFLLALAGSILLAFYAWQHPALEGGIVNLLPANLLDLFPTFTSGDALNGKVLDGDLLPGDAAAKTADLRQITPTAFWAYLLLLWWVSWYPGAEPGGGGYIAQRIMSSRSERDGVLATLWFVVAHYCIRTWPWVLAALAALLLYPHLEGDQKEAGYVYLIRDILPSPWRGLLVASLLGAYMSTLSTHLNWGASYLINDFYGRFLAQNKSERHYLHVSRLATLLLTLFSLVIAFWLLASIRQAWAFLLESTAGLGFVLILRWYWWRINAWSELTAMIVPLVVVAVLRFLLPALFDYQPPPMPESLFLTVPISLTLILTVTYLTAAEDRNTLIRFYERVRPPGPGWKAVTGSSYRGLGLQFLSWLGGMIFVYSLLFSIGSLFLAPPSHILPWLAGTFLGLLLLVVALRLESRPERKSSSILNSQS